MAADATRAVAPAGSGVAVGGQPVAACPRAMSAGEPEAFAEIVAAEHDRALRLAYLLAGDRDAAEDAVAEAFARTYEKWRAGKVGDVGPYVRRAVHNQVKNQRRAIARRRAHEQRRRGDDRGQAGPTGQVAARDTLLDLLERLPHRQRAAIVLRYYEGCSEAETAEALGCRPGTVKSLTSRGTQALRQHAEAAGLDLADAGDAA
jgi:RNA polymerase sigma-70 factor (sigma-E family)